ncbi:hypothetical protein IJG98_02805 [Candidatus Saccharibacteria bacterium]|nr:hypothetical protein [Candidatus Saccharibacteria bacterium]
MATDKQAIKEERKEYLERKQKLLALEKENYARIIMMRATRGFWMTGGHSAVILVNKIAPELKIRIALRRDTDFGDKFKEGVTTFKNLGFYKEKLKLSEYVKLEKEEDDFIVYKLVKKISAAEYDVLLRSKEIRRQKLDGMIVKSIPMPTLNVKLSEVLRLTFKFYSKHSDALLRAFIVEKLADEIRTAHKTFVLICREEIGAMAGLLKVKKILSYALADVEQIVTLEGWSVEDCTVLAMAIIEASMAVDTEVKILNNTKSQKA